MNQKILFSSQHIPPEWIAAHGCQPIKLTPSPERIFEEIGEGICPFAELMLRNADNYDCAAVIFTTRCDQMRRISELSSGKKVFLMNIPATWQSKTALNIFIDELQRLSRFLVKIGGSQFSAEKLKSFIENNHRTIIPHSINNRKKIALMGGPENQSDSEFEKMIEKHGGYIAFNACEQGEIANPVINLNKALQNPAKELANAYFVNMPDIAKRPNTQFYSAVSKVISERKINALIVRTYPWCDIWHAEIPRIKEYFKLPLLNYTVDVNTLTENDSRLKTRLKAFFEML